MDQKMLTVPEAAKYLSIKESFVRRLIRERRITHVKVGHLVRFRQSDLDAFVEANTRAVA